MRYQGYRMDEERTFELEPYLIREFKRRWYLYGHKDYDKDLKTHMYAWTGCSILRFFLIRSRCRKTGMPRLGRPCTVSESTTVLRASKSY